VLGRNDLVGPQRMAYLLNLTRPEGLFSAREFIIRDEDTIYITEAPFASWSRVLSVATTAVSLGGSVAAIQAN
jgi:polysaccharide export outer membrane protein